MCLAAAYTQWTVLHVVYLHGTEVAAVACMLVGLFIGAEIMQSHALGLVNNINTAAA